MNLAERKVRLSNRIAGFLKNDTGFIDTAFVLLRAGFSYRTYIFTAMVPVFPSLGRWTMPTRFQECLAIFSIRDLLNSTHSMP